MPIPVICPSCEADLNLSDRAAGKRIKCPKCGAPMSVPERGKATSPRFEDDEEERDRPRGSRSSRDDREVYSEDQAPPPQSLKKGGIPIWVWCVAGGGVVVALAVFLFGGGFKPRSSRPDGFSAIANHSAGFAVFVPGEIRQATVKHNGEDGNVAGFFLWMGSGQGAKPGDPPSVYVRSNRLPEGYQVDNSPEGLFKLGTALNPSEVMPERHEIDKKAITLDGNPAVLVRVKEKHRVVAAAGGTPEMKQFIEEEIRKSAEQMEKIGKRAIYLITVNAGQLIIISVAQSGAFLDDQLIQKIIDSFRAS